MNLSSILNTSLHVDKDNAKAQVKPGSNAHDERHEAHKKVAEEMESLFAFQLIKTMRETAKSISAEEKSSGQDTYMSMFDMELSKLFAKRGMGLQESIVNWLERMPGTAQNKGNVEKD